MSVHMSVAAVIATGLLLLGLVLTGVGAYVASDAVIISERQANDLATTKWDSNPVLKTALIEQGRAARNGLRFVVAGTFLQGLATVVGTFLALY